MTSKDLSNKINSVSLITAKSQKTGNDYTCIKIEFINGYTYQSFLNSEQLFIINKLANVSNSDISNSNDVSFLDE